MYFAREYHIAFLNDIILKIKTKFKRIISLSDGKLSPVMSGDLTMVRPTKAVQSLSADW